MTAGSSSTTGRGFGDERNGFQTVSAPVDLRGAEPNQVKEELGHTGLYFDGLMIKERQ